MDRLAASCTNVDFIVVDNLVILVLYLHCDRGYDYRESREESLREVAGVRWTVRDCSQRAVIVSRCNGEWCSEFRTRREVPEKPRERTARVISRRRRRRRRETLGGRVRLTSEIALRHDRIYKRDISV